MKGIMGGEKGFLLPYKEVAEKLKIQEDYSLSDLDCWKEEVILKLLRKKGFVSLCEGAVDFDYTKQQKRRIFLKREDLEKRLGISLNHFSAISTFLCCKDGARLRRVNEYVFLARELLGKENFIWIGAVPFLENLDSEEFIETEWK